MISSFYEILVQLVFVASQLKLRLEVKIMNVIIKSKFNKFDIVFRN